MSSGDTNEVNIARRAGAGLIDMGDKRAIAVVLRQVYGEDYQRLGTLMGTDGSEAQKLASEGLRELKGRVFGK